MKPWGVIFTCISTRHEHIEMAHSLDTRSYISAMDRFQNRQGVPVSYHTSNCTLFVGVQRELADCLQNLKQRTIQEHLSRQPTKWIFNPQAAPHLENAWERMVRAAKTMFTLVENVLNSRKLTPASKNPTDPEFVKRNHLPFGQENPNFHYSPSKDGGSRKSWRIHFGKNGWQRQSQAWTWKMVPEVAEPRSRDIAVIIDFSSPPGLPDESLRRSLAPTASSVT